MKLCVRCQVSPAAAGASWCEVCTRQYRKDYKADTGAHLRESSIERYLVHCVKRIGGECRKVKWTGRDGAPDRLVMLPREYVGQELYNEPTLWVELKAPGGKATFPKNPHERKQAREHQRMRKMGQRVEVIDSFEGVDELLGG